MQHLQQSNGGESIDTSKLHRQCLYAYSGSGPHRLKTPGPSVKTIILAVLVMAVTLASVWVRVYS